MAGIDLLIYVRRNQSRKVPNILENSGDTHKSGTALE